MGKLEVNLGPQQQDNETQNTATYKDFCGGYGGAWFTLGNLVNRSRQGFCRFSEKLTGHTWIKFLGGTVTPMPGWDVSYLFRWNTHHGGSEEYNSEKKWCHPGIMLNQKGVMAVMAHQHTHCCKFKKIKFRRPPGWSQGWYDIDDFYNTLLGGYYWTAFDPWNPLGLRPVTTSGEAKDDPGDQQNSKGSMTYFNKWWKERQNSGITLPLPKWTNRKCYNHAWDRDTKNFNVWNVPFGNSSQWWTSEPPRYSPFLPPIFSTSKQNCLWIRYTFYFQLGGRTLQSIVPDWPIKEVDPPPDDTCQRGCEICIKEKDLDPQGILTEKAFRRITRINLSKRERIQHLLKKIKKHIRKQRKHIQWGTRQIKRYTSQ